jgi:Fe-S cluster assembly protein SufD
MSEQLFLTHLQHHFQDRNGDALQPFREKSWLRLTEVGLPNKSREAFRYLPLRELYLTSFKTSHPSLLEKSSFAHAILPECKDAHLVFVDGHFAPEFSVLPSHAVVKSLDEANSFVQHQITRVLKEEQDPFALANLALHGKGVFFYLPPQLHLSSPVQTLYVYTQSSVVAPRLTLALGAQSKMQWISTSLYQQTQPHFVLPATEISLDEGASLEAFHMIESPGTSWHLESIRANLKKNSSFRSFAFTVGAKIVRQSYRIHLKGENSEVDLNGLWSLSKHNTAHFHAIVEHEAPHTRSMQLFKGVLNDFSQSSFEGKILVRPEAQKTEAYQLNKNLILHQGAIANSKPNLEIFADDVKASHGATVAQLDPDQLFYFKTRGIDLHTAKYLLLQGFCREMIDRIPYPSLFQKVQEQCLG